LEWLCSAPISLSVDSGDDEPELLVIVCRRARLNALRFSASDCLKCQASCPLFALNAINNKEIRITHALCYKKSTNIPIKLGQFADPLLPLFLGANITIFFYDVHLMDMGQSQLW
jgi:hypothetical protein